MNSFTQHKPYHREGDDGDQNRAGVGASSQCFEQRALFRTLTGLYEQRAEDGSQHAHCGEDHRDDHRVDAVHGFNPVEGDDAQRAGGQDTEPT